MHGWPYWRSWTWFSDTVIRRLVLDEQKVKGEDDDEEAKYRKIKEANVKKMKALEQGGKAKGSKPTKKAGKAVS